MTGICWRLLAVFSLIFVAPTFLRGQAAAADHAPAIARILTTGPAPWTHLPIAPVWIPPPRVSRPAPVAPGTTIFPQLVRTAGIIFSGRVTSIGRTPSSSGLRQASTTVTFAVERALRGASPGQNLTIHEWAGLWARGERYRVGERVLLFLYSPSTLGLTSPVAGAIGRFAMDPRGRIVIGAQQAAILAADPLLRGKAVVAYPEFARAVRRSSAEE
jgi:hypothetical protein